jgi:hypothetical protein
MRQKSNDNYVPQTPRPPHQPTHTIQPKLTPPTTGQRPVMPANGPVQRPGQANYPLAARGVVQADGLEDLLAKGGIGEKIMSGLSAEGGLATLAQVSQNTNASVEAYRSTYDPTVVLPEEKSDEWAIYGRYGKYVHPLYEKMSGKDRKEYEQTMALYVTEAYNHMVALVKQHKTGDNPQEADIVAQELSGTNSHWKKGNCIAVAVRQGQGPVIALNLLTKKSGGTIASLDKTATGTLEKYPGYEFIDMSAVVYEHCEIRIWEKHGDTLDYIGIMQPCCLFCAAQLLAAGFTGFRGCHFDIYKQYTFSNKILSNPTWLRNLFGAAVADWYNHLDAKQKLDFLDLLAAGVGVKQKMTKQNKKQGASSNKGNNNNNQ